MGGLQKLIIFAKGMNGREEREKHITLMCLWKGQRAIIKLLHGRQNNHMERSSIGTTGKGEGAIHSPVLE